MQLLIGQNLINPSVSSAANGLGGAKQKKEMEKKISPQKAVTNNQICSLRTDHHDLKDFAIMISETGVWLTQQRMGGDVIQKIEIPRKDFNRLIKWYQREQKTVKR